MHNDSSNHGNTAERIWSTERARRSRREAHGSCAHLQFCLFADRVPWCYGGIELSGGQRTRCKVHPHLCCYTSCTKASLLMHMYSSSL